jgi:hypothetical protein
LVLAHWKDNDNLIEASIGTRPPAIRATVTLSLSSSDFDKEKLKEYADKIIIELEEVLKL